MSSLFTELTLISKEFQLVWDIGYRYIIVESNSGSMLELMTDVQHNDFHPHGSLISLVRKLISLP